MQGISVGEFAADDIIWTLVRNMNIVFTPYGWEWRIREGMFAALLAATAARAASPASPAAKVVTIVLWLPIAAVLVLIFDPVLDPSLLEVGVFAVAIWGADRSARCS